MQILVEEWSGPMAVQWERRMTDDEYFQLCADNPDLRIERSAEGDILIMPPVGGESGFRKFSELSAELRNWVRKEDVAGLSIPVWNTSFPAALHIRRTPLGCFGRASIS
jgi:Uma2 family endonuclease